MQRCGGATIDAKAKACAEQKVRNTRNKLIAYGLLKTYILCNENSRSRPFLLKDSRSHMSRVNVFVEEMAFLAISLLIDDLRAAPLLKQTCSAKHMLRTQAACLLQRHIFSLLLTTPDMRTACRISWWFGCGTDFQRQPACTRVLVLSGLPFAPLKSRARCRVPCFHRSAGRTEVTSLSAGDSAPGVREHVQSRFSATHGGEVGRKQLGLNLYGEPELHSW